MKKTTMLRQLLAQKNILVAPGAHDALSAKIVAQAGFDAVYFTGYGQAASHLGGPDVGLMTMTEMVMRARNFAAAVDIPVIASGGVAGIADIRLLAIHASDGIEGVITGRQPG